MTERSTFDYGVSAACLTGLHIYESAARRSGRTEMMLASLKDGDTVICGSPQEANRIDRLCRDRKLKVRVTAHPETARGCAGRIIPDHTFVQRLFEDAIKDAVRHLEHICNWEITNPPGYPPMGLYPVADIARAIGPMRK